MPYARHRICTYHRHPMRPYALRREAGHQPARVGTGRIFSRHADREQERGKLAIHLSGIMGGEVYLLIDNYSMHSFKKINAEHP